MSPQASSPSTRRTGSPQPVLPRLSPGASELVAHLGDRGTRVRELLAGDQSPASSLVHLPRPVVLHGAPTGSCATRHVAGPLEPPRRGAGRRCRRPSAPGRRRGVRAGSRKAQSSRPARPRRRPHRPPSTHRRPHRGPDIGPAAVGDDRILGHDHGRQRVDEHVRPRWRQRLCRRLRRLGREDVGVGHHGSAALDAGERAASLGRPRRSRSAASGVAMHRVWPPTKAGAHCDGDDAT